MADVHAGIGAPNRGLAIALAGFAAITSVAGGLELLAWPRGNAFVPIGLLGGTPFETFVVPGLLLAFVVGGSSLAAAIGAWRRSTFAPDLEILAGAALTVWIAAEIALLCELSWLQCVYGGLGLTMFTLGVSSAWRSGEPRQRWVIGVTAAEAIGFAVPLTAGILTSRSSVAPAVAVAIFAAAGLVEGAVLGLGQAWLLPVRVRRARFVAATAVGAGVVWSAMMIASLAERPAAFAVAGGIGLFVIGAAQWTELVHHARRAWTWILWTALAWGVALPASFLPAPLVDASTPAATNVVLWSSAGLVMAYVMATITWQGARRLERRLVPNR